MLEYYYIVNYISIMINTYIKWITLALIKLTQTFGFKLAIPQQKQKTIVSRLV